MDQTTLIAAIVVGFPLFFGALWCGVLFLLSRVSGWSRLADTYGRGETPTGAQALAWQSGMVGFVSYRNCLHLRATPAGLWLSLAWPLNVGHRPLLIPWNAMHERRETKFLWHRATQVEVGQGKRVRLRLPPEVFDSAPG